MPSLYEILEVPASASPAEIKRAYKNKAMKVHPDRVPAEQKPQAQVEFQKLSAAYEVLSNDATRREYDTTGRIPAGPEPSSSSRANGQNAFFHSFAFGSDNTHPHPFGGGFSGSFFSSFGTRERDPFANDPFFNPHLRNRDNGRQQNAFNVFGGLAGEHIANQDNDFGQTRTFSTSFGNRPQNNGGGGILDAFTRTAFGSLGGALNGSVSGSWSTSIGGNGSSSGNFSSSSSSFSSSTRSVYRNGQWMSETTESNTVNGETKTQTKRSWKDEHGIDHVEYKYGDGSRRYLRGGVEQNVPALPSASRNGN